MALGHPYHATKPRASIFYYMNYTHYRYRYRDGCRYIDMDILRSAYEIRRREMLLGPSFRRLPLPGLFFAGTQGQATIQIESTAPRPSSGQNHHHPQPSMRVASAQALRASPINKHGRKSRTQHEGTTARTDLCFEALWESSLKFLGQIPSCRNPSP